MLFNNVSNQDKLEILTENLAKYEKQLFSDLVSLGP